MQNQQCAPTTKSTKCAQNTETYSQTFLIHQDTQFANDTSNVLPFEEVCFLLLSLFSDIMTPIPLNGRPKMPHPVS